MGHASLRACALSGLSPVPVTVEVHTSGGLPGTTIVGLPRSSVRESKDRVRAAIVHSGFSYPASRVIVNLAPADVPKDGGRFDLSIALGILMATGQLDDRHGGSVVILGELGLAGDVRGISGALPVALWLSSGADTLVLPAANRAEAERSGLAAFRTVESLVDACRLLGRVRLDPKPVRRSAAHAVRPATANRGAQDPVASAEARPSWGRGSTPFDVGHGDAATRPPDLADILGQTGARRALEIAAAGGHNLLLSGPPGTGKSMLASRLPGILPPLEEREALEVASVRSIAGLPDVLDDWGRRPFRAPHHTASAVALAGGGSPPRPGEASLAHLGVLFLDELPEFPRAVLDVLRQPMESGRILIARAAARIDLPARMQVVAAMNPCPCGFLGDEEHVCRCQEAAIDRYRARVSGPFLDRIDLHVPMPRPRRRTLRAVAAGERSDAVRERVIAARRRQRVRQGATNAEVEIDVLARSSRVDPDALARLDTLSDRRALSIRASHRLLRVARTIADLGARERVETKDIDEAFGFRDRSRAITSAAPDLLS